jgi:flagellin
MMQTAEGALAEQSNMLQRMRELAVQSSNGTYSSAQRTYLNTEFAQLLEQIDNTATETTWNGMSLLDATSLGGLSTVSGTFTFQVGQNADETIDVAISAMGQTGLLISGLSVSSASGASTAIDTIDTALDKINTQRATIGAGINQMTYAADNLSNIAANVTASRSSIMDTDYASASTQLSKSQIIQQASTAMLAQANQQPQSVLALLK